jgi:hypothetical protein
MPMAAVASAAAWSRRGSATGTLWRPILLRTANPCASFASANRAPAAQTRIGYTYAAGTRGASSPPSRAAEPSGLPEGAAVAAAQWPRREQKEQEDQTPVPLPGARPP